MSGGKKSTTKKVTSKVPKKPALTPKRLVTKRTVTKRPAVRHRADVKPTKQIKRVKTVRPPVLLTPLPQPVVVQLEHNDLTISTRLRTAPKSWWRLAIVLVITSLALGSMLLVKDNTLLVINDAANVPIVTIPTVDWSTQKYSFKLVQCNLAAPINWSMSSTTDQVITWIDTNHPTTTITMTLYPSTQTMVDWLKQYQTPYFFDAAKQALPALSDRHGLLFAGRNGAGEPLEILYWSSDNTVVEIIVTNSDPATNATILNSFVKGWSCTLNQ